jgi:choline dehydrogenase-like flavoprotein
MTEDLQRDWDLIVVGTGMGGGTLGRALAEKGWSVLFLEKGRSGFRSERQGLNPLVSDPQARLVRGYWPDKVTQLSGQRENSFFAPLGCGVGGSSVFYAGTLERPEPRDLDDSPACPHPTGGWPFRWSELSPWLDHAESMYGVRGGMAASQEAHQQQLQRSRLSSDDTAIMNRLEVNGHKPYALGSAIAETQDCLSCLGTKCPLPCKKDARSAGVEPALATGRAQLLDGCEVIAFRGTHGRVTHVEAVHAGQPLTLRARHFALAAGALSSPRILRASESTSWPKGCGNNHGQVGRHLMFHLNEMFVVWPPATQRTAMPSKAVGLRDLYTAEGRRLGMVQAMGVNVEYGAIVHFLRERMLARKQRALSRWAPLAGWAAVRLLGQAKLFVGLLEDLPYPENRVVLDRSSPDRICFEYNMRPELLERHRLFRQRIRQAFRGMRPMFVNWQPELNHGHACGTLRAGSDPKTSVVDAECRVHDIDNLYVVDASFFPTSMGVNPSLTIAANALRVAHLMEERARWT